MAGTLFVLPSNTTFITESEQWAGVGLLYLDYKKKSHYIFEDRVVFHRHTFACFKKAKFGKLEERVE